MREQGYITPQQVRRKMRTEVYTIPTLFKKVVGYGLIGYGVVTIWAPTGSIWAIAIGCGLVGIDYKKLLTTIKFYGKKTIDWIYGNRTWKLIKRNIRARLM